MPNNTPLTQQAIEQTLKLAQEAGEDPIMLTESSEDKISLPAWLAMIGGHAADGLSTVYARRNPNIIEKNSFAYGSDPSNARILGTKAAIAGLQALMMKLLEKKGQAKAANMMGYTTGAGLGAVAANNIRLSKQ